ncbi:MAG: hypothetical protein PHV74_13240 [Dehalococcoidia bacterium]|nr:hypothetical protein [Dehalococcoidia bacterium]
MLHGTLSRYMVVGLLLAIMVGCAAPAAFAEEGSNVADTGNNLEQLESKILNAKTQAEFDKWYQEWLIESHNQVQAEIETSLRSQPIDSNSIIQLCPSKDRSKPVESDLVTRSSVDYTFWDATTGAHGGDTGGAAYSWHSYNLSENRNNVAGRAVATGWANAWAYNGVTFSNTGASAQTAVLVSGWSAVQMTAGAGGSCDFNVYAEIRNVTDSTTEDSQLVATKHVGSLGSANVYIYWYGSLDFNFEAGHTYKIIVYSESEVNQSSLFFPQISELESGDSGHHTYWNYIMLDW